MADNVSTEQTANANPEVAYDPMDPRIIAWQYRHVIHFKGQEPQHTHWLVTTERWLAEREAGNGAEVQPLELFREFPRG